MYKLVESCNYGMGENHYKWYLYTGLYQHRDIYYYIIFDIDDAENIIISCIVSTNLINELEKAILEAMRNSNRMEKIEDFYDELQNTFYGNMFKWK